MKIVDIETKLRYIELKTPFITALRRVERVEYVSVKVVCDSGVSAYGEASATKAITGEDTNDIVDSISKIKPKLTGLDIDMALEVLHKSFMGSSAKAAIDIALISLKAKQQQKTLCVYLGAKEIQSIKTDITISLDESQKMLLDSKEALQNNQNILKLKFGKDINHAIKVTKLVHKECDNAKLLIDANQAWDVESTMHYIKSTKDIKLQLIEQPVAADDIKAMYYITQHTDIKILADESVFHLEDAKKVIESKSADMINVKLMKCGGLSKAVGILEYARENGIKCMLGSMLEGYVSINAALHLALAYSDVVEYVDLDSPLLYKELSDELDFVYDGCEIRFKN